MAYNGSGTFQRLRNFVTDAANAIKIRADLMDSELDGFATGLTTALTKDGQTTPTAALPMGGFNHTGVGAATARNQYATMAQMQDQGGVYVATVAGTADAITLTPSPAITAYAAGQRFAFIASGTNTTTVTIATSGLATRAVTKEGSTALVAGDIVSGVLVIVQDDGTRYQLVSVGGVATKHGANTFTKTQTWSKGADVASDTAVTLGADGNYFDITGTTAITSLATKGIGTVVKLHFDGILTLTHHSTDLVLPGAANITTAAGDEAEFIEYATGDWRCTKYQKASGLAVVSPAQTIVQVIHSTTAGAAGSSGTGVMNFDNTKPQNSEGNEFLVGSVTPTSASNKLLIEVTGYICTSAEFVIIGALFQDTTADALSAAIFGQPAANVHMPVLLRHYMDAGTTSSTTFKFRAGSSSAATTFFGTNGSGVDLGALLQGCMTITEIAV